MSNLLRLRRDVHHLSRSDFRLGLALLHHGNAECHDHQDIGCKDTDHPCNRDDHGYRNRKRARRLWPALAREQGESRPRKTAHSVVLGRGLCPRRGGWRHKLSPFGFLLCPSSRRPTACPVLAFAPHKATSVSAAVTARPSATRRCSCLLPVLINCNRQNPSAWMQRCEWPESAV